ncbi:arf-GAP with dual PH domain-containing protein 1-like isoform X2 [Oscarella lobularis]|uniref:arf-GAP with dual PH domain-containing protein 1-like isoform X2 n=1 Tax=Oscarella lobularis TaxID=121494 RepID=UPI0033143430
MAAERNRRAMEQLAKLDGNDRCAECRRENPDWVAIVQNLSLAVFVCTECCGSHRAPGRTYVRTKSIQLDKFDDDEVQLMMASGNRKSNAILEKHYHPCFKRPSSECCPRVLRDQWVTAKYQRHDFKDGSPQPSYLAGCKHGDLFKREKSRNEYNKRYFELSESDNTLRYYVKRSDAPKETLILTEINAVLIEDALEIPNGMHLMYYNPKENRTRHYYVRSATGQEIIEWYVAIRHAKAKRLGLYSMGRDEQWLSMKMSRDFVKTGHLWKTGPKDNRFSKRWFILDQKILYYFERPLDPYALNEVVLGHTSEGYRIDEGTTAKTTKAFTMSLTVPSIAGSSGRVYPLAADDDHQWKLWLDAFRRVMAWLPGQDEAGPIENGKARQMTYPRNQAEVKRKSLSLPFFKKKNSLT